MAKYYYVERKQVGLRLPEALLQNLKEAAQVNNRSLNSEMVTRLEHSFIGHDRDAFLSWLDAQKAELDDLRSQTESLIAKLEAAHV